MKTVWTKRSGTKLAVLQEGEFSSVLLPASEASNIDLISGEIPPGMQIIDNTVIGTPLEVPRNTIYRFVLRATVQNKVYDRTYSIEIQGEDEPSWVTPEDLLPVGKDETYFILDSSPIDYQLEAVDSDTRSGQNLRYFIPSNGGELPPGITLTEDGRLVGVIDPILALEKEAANGNFDSGRFDRYPYDFAVAQVGDFDSFAYDVSEYVIDDDLSGGEDLPEKQKFSVSNNLGYDSRPYDLTRTVRTPKKLNRYYEFTVSVSDGDTVKNRTFRIFVVGDDFLRADNVVMQVGTGIFTADNTYLRSPVWLTPSELGVRRANNFITLFLDTLDPTGIPGTIVYDLLPENNDNTPSELPPGTEFDRNNGEIFGRVPYQPAVTKDYKFTVNARRIEARDDKLELQKFTFEPVSKGSLTIKINKLNELSSRAVGRTFIIGTNSYRVNSVDTSHPDYDVITINKPLFDDIKQGREINLGVVSLTSLDVAETAKTFRVQLLGEVDSTIQWLTKSDLGTIPSNYVSTLYVKAETNVPNSFLLYTLEHGVLPPGLSLSFNGEIIGRVDNNLIETDKVYSFTIRARDQFGFSAIEQTFSLTVENSGDAVYSNVYYKPLLSLAQRTEFANFVNDSEIFSSDVIYRPEDENFGIQSQIKILVYAGIETKNVRTYVAAAAKHASRKTLKVRDIKKAIAKEPGTNNVIYEVVYLDVYDPYEKSGNVSKTLKTDSDKEITVDTISTTPKNSTYDTNNLSWISIGQRINKKNKTYFQNSPAIETREGTINLPINNDTTVLKRGSQEIKFDFYIGSSTNIFYRPENENTIKADSNALKISDPNSNVKYISNISNIRDQLRDIGKSERNFLPLWMRTAQQGTLQELGYTLAVPLAYCKPGTADSVLSGLRVKNFDFRQFDLEVDRFVIDATEDNNQEQYILFANYAFNLA